MKRYIPSLMWLAALVALYHMDTTTGVSICFFKFIGFDHCPGCGIGHSIHSTLHFNFSDAVKHHILGIPSTVALIWLIIKPLTTKHTSYESATVNDAESSTG